MLSLLIIATLAKKQVRKKDLVWNKTFQNRDWEAIS